MTALYLDNIGVCLLRQLAEAWEAMHVTRDDIGDVTYGGRRRERELITRNIDIDDLAIAFAQHVSFLYDNRAYDPRVPTAYPISDTLLNEIAQMEFEQRFQGFVENDTLTEIAVEALKGWKI